MVRSLTALLLVMVLVACGGSAESTETANEPPIEGTAAPAEAEPDGNAEDPIRLPPTEPAAATPTPTLAAIEPVSISYATLIEQMNPFLADGCDLPCYGGLEPGESSTQDVLAFYANLGIGVDDYIPGDYLQAEDRTGRLGAWLLRTEDLPPANALPPRLELYVEDDALRYAYVVWGDVPDYASVPTILQQLGQPSQIDMRVIQPPRLQIDEDIGQEAVLAFTLRLIYQEDEALSSYGFSFEGLFRTDQAEPRMCFQEPFFSATMGTFAPGEVPLEDALTDLEGLAPLEEVLGLSYQAFADELADDGCVPVSFEQIQQWSSEG
ncbi:MAG: hypothetical protein GYB68_11640 [Chloroflexi bacterium]|nr:hypothetical protein [Chloroflexota bacterium]